jgi:hypothetical protein
MALRLGHPLAEGSCSGAELRRRRFPKGRRPPLHRARRAKPHNCEPPEGRRDHRGRSRSRARSPTSAAGCACGQNSRDIGLLLVVAGKRPLSLQRRRRQSAVHPVPELPRATP